MSGAARDHRAARRRGPPRPRGAWRARSPRPRACCWSATPTTRRATALPAGGRSTPSWPSCRATWRVIVDEAYVEFSTLQDPDESLELLDRHPNLVLLRTFSKVYGLCGLRVGYALGSESFRLAVDRVRQPFSVNALALAAAAEAIRHQDEVERRVEQTAIERLHVESELEERGLESTDSEANFSWVALGRSRRGRGHARPGRARRDRAGRRGAGRGGPPAGDLRHPRRRTTASSRRWTRCWPGWGGSSPSPARAATARSRRRPRRSAAARPTGRAGPQVCGSRCARTWLGREHAIASARPRRRRASRRPGWPRPGRSWGSARRIRPGCEASASAPAATGSKRLRSTGAMRRLRPRGRDFRFHQNLPRDP